MFYVSGIFCFIVVVVGNQFPRTLIING